VRISVFGGIEDLPTVHIKYLYPYQQPVAVPTHTLTACP